MNPRITASIVVGWLIFCPVEASAAHFFRLGALNGGNYYSEALNISPDGQVVVGSAVLGEEGWEAFRWTKATGVQGLGDIPGGILYSKAQSTSNGGAVIVGLGSSQGDNAFLDGFRWTQETGPLPIGYFDTSATPPYNYALGVSADGKVIVGVSGAPEGNQAYRWTEQDGMVRIGDLPGGRDESYAWDVSADGRVIVGTSSTDRSVEAFRWTAETGMQSLGELPNALGESHAWAASADGSTIVGQSGRDAWRWTEGTGLVSIGTLPGFGDWPVSAALGVTADGGTIVGDIRSNNYQAEAAFVWSTTRGMRNLQAALEADYNLRLPGWTLTHATAISDDGMVIVGSGINPLGNTEAWVVNLAAPEPSAVVISVMGLLCLASKQGARRRQVK
jgi:probable HAF family extracellular repeat protein